MSDTITIYHHLTFHITNFSHLQIYMTGWICAQEHFT